MVADEKASKVAAAAVKAADAKNVNEEAG